jgi:hypothetical protein
MTKENQLSPVMLKCLDFLREGDGSIYRHPGGYWGAPLFKLHGSFGTSTIEGLVKRGILVYVEWQEGRSGRFPIRAMRKNQYER